MAIKTTCRGEEGRRSGSALSREDKLVSRG